MAEMHKLDLDITSLHIVEDILHRHVPERPVFAFGSRTFGRSGRRSDLDLAIGGDEPLRTSILSDLKDDFSESDLPIFVDVLDVNAVDPGFLKRIEPHFLPVQEPRIDRA